MRRVDLQRGAQLQSMQILRALAATSVVYYHVGRAPLFGSFGVDLFFVLSGFVIAMIAGNRSTAVEFARNRITRVAPLYWILTSATLVLTAVKPTLFTTTTANLYDYLRSIFFIPYFKYADVLQPMLGVGWTLNYEMLFYLLATVALLSAPRRYFARTTTALVVLVWAVGMILPASSAYGAFLSSDLLFEFTLGILAWNIKDARLWEHIPMAVMLLAAIALYVLMAYFETIAAPYRLLSYGIPAFLIVVACFRLEPLLRHLHSRLVRILVHIGDASYATYLSHLYFVDFGKRVVGRYIGEAMVTSVPGAAVIIVASLVGGSLVYLFLDKPAVWAARSLSRGFVRQRLVASEG